MRKKLMLTLLGVFFFLLTMTYSVEAKGVENIGFYIKPVIPKTQLDVERQYFYIQTKPGESQRLKVHVGNTSSETKTIKIDIGDAFSSENGEIAYGTPEITDSTLANPVTDLIKTKDDEITLKANEDKLVEFTLTPPDKHYDGVKMGSITFTHGTGEKIDGMVNVKNAYRVSVVLSETKDTFKEGSQLNLMDVTPSMSRGRRVIQANIQNPEAKIIEGLSIDARITNLDKGKEVMQRNVYNYRIAPNSTLPFMFDWGLSDLAAGKYNLKMNIDNNEHQFSLEKDFIITGAMAMEINDASPFKIKTPTWVKIATLFMGFCVLVAIIILINRQKKWRSEVKHQRKRHKKKHHKKRRKGERGS